MSECDDVFLEPFRANLHPDIEALEPVWRRAELSGFATQFRPIMLLPLVRYRRAGLRVISMLDFEVCDYLAPVLFPGPDLPSDSSHGSTRSGQWSIWAVVTSAWRNLS